MDWVTIASIIAAAVGIVTFIKTILEILKLIGQLGDEGKKALRLSLLGVSLLGILLLTMFVTNWILSVEKRDIASQKVEAENKAQNYLENVEKLEQNIIEYRSKSIEEFIRLYQVRISRSDEAINRYFSFDTEVNRKEYGNRFQKRQNELLEEATVKLNALLDHIEKWKPVSEDLQKAVNGRVHSIDEALKGKDYEEAFRSLRILKETSDSDITRLRNSLSNAAKSE